MFLFILFILLFIITQAPEVGIFLLMVFFFGFGHPIAGVVCLLIFIMMLFR